MKVYPKWFFELQKKAFEGKVSWDAVMLVNELLPDWEMKIEL